MARENPHLLLLDIEMPEESGLDYLRELKAEATSPAVIVVTAYGSEKVAVEAMKSGAFDYLSKPYEVDELRLKVERAFEQLALAEENLRLKRQLVSEGQFGSMIGSSTPNVRLATRMSAVASLCVDPIGARQRRAAAKRR